MNGVPVLKILIDQFYSHAPEQIVRPGLRWLQFVWLVLGSAIGVCYGFWGDIENGLGSVLAANAIFTALSLTMAMFFWPKAINLKNDPDFLASPTRWHVYRLTTQLFWTVLIGIIATGLAIVQVGISATGFDLLIAVGISICVGLTAYQVLLLGQSVISLYAATYWMPKA